MVCSKTMYVQKATNPRKYGSANKIPVSMDNGEIRISEEVSSKGNLKLTNSI